MNIYDDNNDRYIMSIYIEEITKNNIIVGICLCNIINNELYLAE